MMSHQVSSSFILILFVFHHNFFFSCCVCCYQLINNWNSSKNSHTDSYFESLSVRGQRSKTKVTWCQLQSCRKRRTMDLWGQRSLGCCPLSSEGADWTKPPSLLIGPAAGRGRSSDREREEPSDKRYWILTSDEVQWGHVTDQQNQLFSGGDIVVGGAELLLQTLDEVRHQLQRLHHHPETTHHTLRPCPHAVRVSMETAATCAGEPGPAGWSGPEASSVSASHSSGSSAAPAGAPPTSAASGASQLRSGQAEVNSHHETMMRTEKQQQTHSGRRCGIRRRSSSPPSAAPCEAAATPTGNKTRHVHL